MSTERPTYTVRIWRDAEDPSYWLAASIDDERAHTFGRTVAEARAMAVDALALWFRRDLDSFDVEYRVELPAGLDDLVTDVVERRERIQALERP